MGQQHNQPGFTDQSLIRNFCIIAHIDHGKSTVADRILQLSGIVPEREMRDRFLDRMDIEQERGITIKSQAVRVPWTFDGTEYTLGMIDTPGHVDFTYEVSRALAACEGAVLLVDATQGIEAQTLSNLYMAIDHDLAIIPVLNKIDLPSAEPDKHAEEIVMYSFFRLFFIKNSTYSGIQLCQIYKMHIFSNLNMCIFANPVFIILLSTRFPYTHWESCPRVF